MKKIMYILCTAAIVAGCLCGCGGASDETPETVAQSGGTAAADDNDGTAGETSETEPEEPSSDAVCEPSKEILEASLSSGLVQVGDEVFKNGGYMTFREFMEQYGDKYEPCEDLPYYDVDEELAPESVKWECLSLDFKQKSTGVHMSVDCGRPANGGTACGDWVVLRFRAGNYEEEGNPEDFSENNTWLPSGISNVTAGTDEKTLETVAALYESQGLTFVEYENDNGVQFDINDPEKEAGKYTQFNFNTDAVWNKDLRGAVKLDETNLYGETTYVMYSYSLWREERVATILNDLWEEETVVLDTKDETYFRCPSVFAGSEFIQN